MRGEFSVYTDCSPLLRADAMALAERRVLAVLLDITGVLKNCVDGKDVAIEGSVDAVNR